MSPGSKLESDLAFAIKAVGLPEPVREFHFAWCCEHPRREHYPASGPPRHWYHAAHPPGCRLCPLSGTVVHEYSHDRNWRADFAWPERRLLVECDGGTYTGGRHVRGDGYERDAEKSNAANLGGWRVLHFTQRQITSGEALTQIERALEEAV